ncbi:MAG: hypothetical protein AB1646_10355 [Thermodesulfobacteriota bacterium]
MERLRNLLRQREFHVLLFCLAIVLVSWPLVSFSDLDRLKAMFAYLFLVWGLIIMLLLAVSRGLNDAPKQQIPWAVKGSHASGRRNRAAGSRNQLSR